jgi:hypothetical protein
MIGSAHAFHAPIPRQYRRNLDDGRQRQSDSVFIS